MFLRPIVPPSLSFNAPLASVAGVSETQPQVSTQPYVVSPVSENGPDLFPIYYGYPMPEVVELVNTEPREVPASINDAGYLNVPSTRRLAAMDEGVPLGQAAAFGKTHRPHRVHVYTNEDIERLNSK